MPRARSVSPATNEPLEGTKLSGEKIAVQGCDLLEFRGDKIFHIDSYWKIIEH